MADNPNGISLTERFPLMTATLTAPAARVPYGDLRSYLSSLIVANFGSSDDHALELPPDLRRLITLIEIDANAGSHIPENYYGKIIRIRKAIAGRRGTRPFYISRYPGASSLLPCDRKLVGQYAMERFLETVDTKSVECTTVEDALAENGLAHLDFLKTDLEGMDFEVIKSCEALFGGILAVQAELRFQPFFIGEPRFHEVVEYLSERGFELVGLKPEWWKYNTSHRDRQRKGRVVWADSVFFKNPDELLRMPTGKLLLAKQIFLAVMLRHENYAEFLLGEYRSHLPEPVRTDLATLIASRASNKSELRNPEFPHGAAE